VSDLPVLAAPRRLFRVVPGPDPLALPLDRPDGPCDDPASWRVLHLWGSRRGAMASALAANEGGPTGLTRLFMADLRCTDPRPVLDARHPAALPPDLAALVAAGAWRALAERADDAGLAGLALPVAAAPSQTLFALLDPSAVRSLAPPKPVSPHDPDLRALTRDTRGPESR
jgi:hypothetical protein